MSFEYMEFWVMRKQSSYAFINFDDRKDAQNAICDLNGKRNWRVELSHYSRGGGDCSSRVHGSGELGSDNSHYCCRTHPNDRRSEHHYLSTIHCFKFRSLYWYIG